MLTVKGKGFSIWNYLGGSRGGFCLLLNFGGGVDSLFMEKGEIFSPLLFVGVFEVGSAS